MSVPSSGTRQHVHRQSLLMCFDDDDRSLQGASTASLFAPFSAKPPPPPPPSQQQQQQQQQQLPVWQRTPPSTSLAPFWTSPTCRAPPSSGGGGFSDGSSVKCEKFFNVTVTVGENRGVDGSLRIADGSLRWTGKREAARVVLGERTARPEPPAVKWSFSCSRSLIHSCEVVGSTGVHGNRMRVRAGRHESKAVVYEFAFEAQADVEAARTLLTAAARRSSRTPQQRQPLTQVQRHSQAPPTPSKDESESDDAAAALRAMVRACVSSSSMPFEVAQATAGILRSTGYDIEPSCTVAGGAWSSSAEPAGLGGVKLMHTEMRHAQRAERERTQEKTGVTIHSPDKKALVRGTYAFTDRITGRAVSPRSYERRYRERVLGQHVPGDSNVLSRRTMFHDLSGRPSAIPFVSEREGEEEEEYMVGVDNNKENDRSGLNVSESTRLSTMMGLAKTLLKDRKEKLHATLDHHLHHPSLESLA